MLTRIITAVVALAVLVGVLIAPPVVFTIALAAVILIMLHECYSAVKADKTTKCIGFVASLLVLISTYFLENHIVVAALGIIALCILYVLVSMVPVVIKHGKKNYSEVLACGFITFYVLATMISLWIIKSLFGTANMIVVFICAWSTDTFAYFTGYFLGKHKLIPHVSPKKTVEGAIGGVIGAMVITIAYLAVTKNAMQINNMSIWTNIYIQGAIIGLVGGVCSQLGDLAASAIKRDTGIKDFGNIFPGHGGFMDRFDSVMFISPLVLIVMFIMQMF